ncbi:hypothetical protein [uncultured Clostridium sp.]|uniref:hypothetical protein n=1 Tax=uncultured Clostridium sp. TaxID=59620 RepID=UPI0026321B84|nr:hypothetical protein [uncultured Clostridium sp.]
MRKRLLLVLSISAIATMFVGCDSKDGIKGGVIPKYFEVEENKDLNIEGFETEYSKLYDINNDGIWEQLDLVKKDGEAYILIKHAETEELKSAIKINANSKEIEKILDEDNDGIEEIIVLKEDNKEDIYHYNPESKGYEL